MAMRRAARLNPAVPPQDEGEEDQVAFGPAPAQQQGDNQEAEPEQEPEGQADVQEEREREEKSPRVDLRNIKTSPFDGAVPAGQFDAKASALWAEFSEQVADAQLLAGQTWSDAVKKAVLMQFLTGMARRWFREWRVSYPEESFDACGGAMVREFRPNLLHTDIAERIRGEKRRWDDTYREYAGRLLQMADALDGGIRVESNARQALVAFTRNAYPRFTDFVEAKVDMRGPRPTSLLAAAVSALSDKAGTDGRAMEKHEAAATIAPAVIQNKKPQAAKFAKKVLGKNDKKPEKKRAAEANVAVVERKRTMASASGASQKRSITCYECGQSGHTASFCRKYLQGKGIQEGPAEANQAEVEESDSSSESEEEE